MIKKWLYPEDEEKVALPLQQNFNLFRVVFYQATGSLLFGYGICCATTMEYGSFFISLSLWLAICWGGEFTGGHFNGAVTLGCVLRKDGMGFCMGLVYFFSQILGVFVGNFMAFGLNGAPVPEGDATPMINSTQLMFNQVWGTFIFVFFILHCTCPDTTFMDNSHYCKPFIPLILYIGRSFAALTGSLNPSVAMGMQLYAAVINQPRHRFAEAWVVTVLGPFLGGAIAAVIFEQLYRPMMISHKTRASEISSADE